MSDYLNPGPEREDIDKLTGFVVLEFGTDWCGHCQAAKSPAEEAMLKFPAIQHIKIEDGKGRSLGRSFHVKLWPTFIFLKDGAEVSRLVRPVLLEEIEIHLQRLFSP